jgi:uncharacterized protein (TIGR00251 family)
MSDLPLSERDGAVLIPVRVQPRASREAVTGVHDGALKIALTAPPVEGEANLALVAFLAKQLGVPKRDVQIVQGATGRQKLVAVRGTTVARVRALVAQSGMVSG